MQNEEDSCLNDLSRGQKEIMPEQMDSNNRKRGFAF